MKNSRNIVREDSGLVRTALARGRLWYSDFYRHGIYSMRRRIDEVLEHEVATQPSASAGRTAIS